MYTISWFLSPVWKQQQNYNKNEKIEKVEELSCLFNNMSFITEMGEMGDMKMDNEKNNLKIILKI